MADRANRLNERSLSLEDKWQFTFRLKVDGVYQPFTGKALDAKIWNAETNELLLTISTVGGGITFSTETVTDDRVTCVFSKAQIETLDPGTYKVRVFNDTDDETILSGKVNFVNGAPSV